jgi:hypothetical protein
LRTQDGGRGEKRRRREAGRKEFASVHEINSLKPLFACLASAVPSAFGGLGIGLGIGLGMYGSRM